MANETLIRKRIATAQRRLQAARLLFDQGFTNDALSKSYYADFFEAEKERTEEQIKDAERFINMAISFLQTRGFDFTS